MPLALRREKVSELIAGLSLGVSAERLSKSGCILQLFDGLADVMSAAATNKTDDSRSGPWI